MDTTSVVHDTVNCGLITTYVQNGQLVVIPSDWSLFTKQGKTSAKRLVGPYCDRCGKRHFGGCK